MRFARLAQAINSTRPTAPHKDPYIAPDNWFLADRRESIGTDLAGKYLLVVGEDNVVEQKYVTLGPIQEDGTVVVEDGLDGSESYIVNGLLRARPGFPVTPQTEAEVASGQSSPGSGGF